MLVLIFATTGTGVWLLNEWGLVDNFSMLLFIFSASAVSVIVPVLKQREELGVYGQVLLVAGFLLEFGAIISIGTLAAIEREGLGLEFWLILAMPLAFGILLWLVTRGRNLFPGATAMLRDLAHASSQIQIRTSLTVLVMFVVLSQVVGTELVLGAFLAGLALTILSPRHGSIMRVKQDALGYGFFVPIFFITSGAVMDLDAVVESSDTLLLVPAFLGIAVAGKLLPALLIWWPTFGLRRTLAGGALLSANLSIILAAGAIALELGLIDNATNAALLIVALVTTAVTPIAFNRILPAEGPHPAVGRVLLVGAGRTGRELTPRLRKAGMAVTVVDLDAERLATLAGLGCEIVEGDIHNPAIVAQADPCTAEVALISMDEPARTYSIAGVLRSECAELRILTWAGSPDPRLELLNLETYSLGAATAAVLEGAVLRPGLLHALEGDDTGIREVTLRNAALHLQPLRHVQLPGNVRVLLISRDGALVVPDGDTTLEVLDRLTLAGDPEAVLEAGILIADAPPKG